MRRNRGVTLLELLIAISLLSLLSVGILYAVRLGLDSMDRTNRKLMANRRALGVQRIIDQQIAGFMPVRAECRPSPQAPPQFGPFFQGEPQTLRFVSTYSLHEAHRGVPRIIEYQVIPGENGEGVRLVVNERPFTGPFATSQICLGVAPDPLTQQPIMRFLPVEVGPASFVLADKLAYCRMSFKESLPDPPFERWHLRWGLPKNPSAIRIEMAPLRPDPSRLQLVSLTAPVRVTRDPLQPYGDLNPVPRR